MRLDSTTIPRILSLAKLFCGTAGTLGGVAPGCKPWSAERTCSLDACKYSCARDFLQKLTGSFADFHKLLVEAQRGSCGLLWSDRSNTEAQF